MKHYYLVILFLFSAITMGCNEVGSIDASDGTTVTGSDSQEAISAGETQGTIVTNPGQSSPSQSLTTVTGNFDTSGLDATNLSFVFMNGDEELASTTDKNFTVDLPVDSNFTIEVHSKNDTTGDSTKYAQLVFGRGDLENMVVAIPSGNQGNTIDLGTITDEGNATFKIENDLSDYLSLKEYLSKYSILDHNLNGIIDNVDPHVDWEKINNAIEIKGSEIEFCEFSNIDPYDGYILPMDEDHNVNLTLKSTHDIETFDFSKIVLIDLSTDKPLTNSKQYFDVTVDGKTVEINGTLPSENKYQLLLRVGALQCGEDEDGNVMSSDRFLDVIFKAAIID
jgi:hypothetical protein